MTQAVRNVSRNRLIAVLVVGASIVAMASALAAGIDPSRYFSYGSWYEQNRKFEIPWSAIANTLALMSAYGLLVYCALADLRFATWIRAGIICAILVGWMAYVIRFVIHSPGYWLVQYLFLASAIIVCGLAFLISGGTALWRKLSTRWGMGHA